MKNSSLRHLVQALAIATLLGAAVASAEPIPTSIKTADQLVETWKVGTVTGKVTTTTRVVPLDHEYARAVVAALGGKRALTRSDDRPVFNAEKPKVKVEKVRLQVLASTVVPFPNLLFVLDKSNEFQDAASQRQLDEIAKALIDPRLKDVDFLIEGHTCDLGKDDYNLKLSKARAHYILEFLVSKGVARERLIATGLGEAEPEAKGTSEKERQKNRRVVFSVVK